MAANCKNCGQPKTARGAQPLCSTCYHRSICHACERFTPMELLHSDGSETLCGTCWNVIKRPAEKVAPHPAEMPPEAKSAKQ